MRKTKRETNQILLSFILSIAIFSFFIYISYFFLYVEISKIEEQKLVFKDIVKEYDDLNKRWLNLEDIKKISLSNKEELSENIQKFLNEKTNVDMLKKVPKSFYDKNFINTWSINYEAFLNNKIEKIQSSNLKDDFIITQEKLFTVLPIYSDKASFYTDKSMTNFSFVSNIENILNKFNLETSSELWISNLSSVNNTDDTKKWSLDEWIYYIPLKLDLKWSKLNILNFLDYIQSSWSIKFVNWSLDIINTNQLSDIESISMKDYIDSSTSNTDSINTQLKDLIINTSQSQEKYEISVNLRFYIVWIPAYKVKTEALKVIWKNNKQFFNYFELKTKTQQLLKKSETFWESNYKVKQLKNINSYLNEISKDINSLNTSLNKNESLENVFESSRKYKIIFEAIYKNLTEIQKSLNLK